MSIFSTFLGLCWLLCALVGPALGLNTPHLYQWKFSDETIPTNLPTCVTFGIIVESANITTNATIGVPPYYMISLPIGGTPQIQLIGSDQNNLMWTVAQPVGSQMLLSVVDSQQNPGGIPGREFTVIAGQTTQCVTTPISTPAFTVSANVTTDLETCAPWGLTVVGGTPPFTVTLAQTNVPIVTNVSMDFGTDRFTFINRAHPTGTLIAAVSDL
ncbi:hypothetical protein BDN70DRAFT_183152 [Pholiota conissans]|uniref:Uncharacterized protein n=1 Tax=Pholiota conissans TaxID=109636 RepID=A0A9P5YW87_9AGAR|nr:hypothetical protein BDN70DRAFT_183152 [Pholiota conissans]